MKNFTGQVAIISSGNTCQQKIFENIISELKIYQSRLFSSYLVLISKIWIFPMDSFHLKLENIKIREKTLKKMLKIYLKVLGLFFLRHSVGCSLLCYVIHFGIRF